MKIIKSITFILLIFSVFILLSTKKTIFGIRTYVVLTGSMSPTISPGSLIITATQKNYYLNDIVTFEHGNIFITHRLVKINSIGDSIFYQTKGDANSTNDIYTILKKDIRGKVIFQIPLIGKIISILQTFKGFFLLIVIPACIYIALELYSVHKLLIRKTISVLFLFVCLSSVTTYAFLTDQSQSRNNIFASTNMFPLLSPSPTINTHIVISEIQISSSGVGGTSHDFVELYNPTNIPFDLSGHRLVKRTGTSSLDTTLKSWTSSAIIPSYGFYLWASTVDSYNISINADASSSATIAANNSVALRRGSENTGQIVDAVSWNSAGQSLKEGAEFPSNPLENQSLERKAYLTSSIESMLSTESDALKGNAFDSDNNSVDFIIRPLSQPQNTTSAGEFP